MAEQKMKRLWDNYQVIGEVRKSDKIKLVVGAGVRDGVKYLNIREFYYRLRDGAWMPGRDGITVPIVIPVNNGEQLAHSYEGLMKVMKAAADVLETMPLEDEEHAVYMPVKEKGDKK